MRKALIWSSFVVLAAAGPVLAEEIVYFTNGTSMVIETHEIDEATKNLRVQLPGAAMMEFPLDQVSKIEDAQGVVTIPGPSANVVNRGSQSYRVEGTRPARHRRDKWQTTQANDPDDDVVVRKGIPTYRPFGSSAAPNKRQLAVAGRRGLNEPDLSRRTRTSGSTSRTGARQAIPAPGAGSRRPQPVPVQAKK